MALTEDEIKDIRTAIENAARPLFFFDDDPDGVCSFLQLYKITGEGKGIIVKVASELKEEFAKKVEEYQPDLVVILDVPVVSQNFLDKISQRVIWLDHHPVVQRKGVDYFNPRKHNDEDNRPTSYWAWKIACKSLWIAMAGCVSDWFVPDFKEEFIQQYPDLFSSDIEKPDVALFETPIGLIGRMIAFNLKGTVSDSMKSVKILTRIEHPEEILSQSTPRGKFIYKKYEKQNKEYSELIKNVKADKSKLLLFVYPDDKTSFTSELSNELLHIYPDKMILVGREKDSVIKFSARGKEMKVLPIIQKALQKIDGRGGGHDYACGFSIFREDLDPLVNIIKKELKN